MTSLYISNRCVGSQPVNGIWRQKGSNSQVEVLQLVWQQPINWQLFISPFQQVWCALKKHPASTSMSSKLWKLYTSIYHIPSSKLLFPSFTPFRPAQILGSTAPPADLRQRLFLHPRGQQLGSGESLLPLLFHRMDVEEVVHLTGQGTPKAVSCWAHNWKPNMDDESKWHNTKKMTSWQVSPKKETVIQLGGKSTNITKSKTVPKKGMDATTLPSQNKLMELDRVQRPYCSTSGIPNSCGWARFPDGSPATISTANSFAAKKGSGIHGLGRWTVCSSDSSNNTIILLTIIFWRKTRKTIERKDFPVTKSN